MSIYNTRNEYINNVMLPGFRSDLEADRSDTLEDFMKKRSLSSAGQYLFNVSLEGYICGCCDEANQVLSKAEAFLRLGRATSEVQKHSYVPNFSEGQRSSALSYIGWLRTGTIDESLLIESLRYFEAAYDQSPKVDRHEAELMAPLLLYLKAHELTKQIGRLLQIPIDQPSLIQRRGIFAYALRIALAANPEERQLEVDALRKKLGKQLFTWIVNGNYRFVAYTLHALVNLADGPPYLLLENCWKHIPKEVIK